MIDITIIIIIMGLHWIGDFLLQTRYMAVNKSTSNKTLLSHMIMYSLPLLLINPMFALVNGVLHGMVDYVTSRLSSKAYKENNMHMFFSIIGLDQFLHTVCLLVSYVILHKYGFILWEYNQ